MIFKSNYKKTRKEDMASHVVITSVFRGDVAPERAAYGSNEQTYVKTASAETLMIIWVKVIVLAKNRVVGTALNVVVYWGTDVSGKGHVGCGVWIKLAEVFARQS